MFVALFLSLAEFSLLCGGGVHFAVNPVNSFLDSYLVLCSYLVRDMIVIMLFLLVWLLLL